MKIALVYNWPGIKNSELDMIGRIRKLLENKGHQSFIVDPFGKLLDESGEYINPRKNIDESALDFILNFHFSSPNFIDSFSYFTNWNPIDYLRRDPSTLNPISQDMEFYIANCMVSHDISLRAGSDEVNNYFNAINTNNPAFIGIEGPEFYTSCQIIENIKPVKLDNPRIFYIGINWEKLLNKNANYSRHDGLLEKLDEAGFTDFYGVEKINNINMWEGFNNYNGELPFDNGISIAKISNSCGISLVLSSRSHRESELISTRVFQACAARTVIIADDNKFLKNNFEDSYVCIQLNEDPENNFHQIYDAYNWIKQNPDLAKNKAEQAYRIFCEKYTLDMQTDKLIKFHNDLIQLQKDNAIEDVDVEIIWVVRSADESDLKQYIHNLGNQKRIKILATIIISQEHELLFKSYLNNTNFEYILHVEEELKKPLGFYIKKHIRLGDKSGYLSIYSKQTQWKSNHLELLVKSIHNRVESITHAGGCIKNDLWEGKYNINAAKNSLQEYFNSINIMDIIKFNFDRYCSSSFLIKKNSINNSLLNVVANLDNGHWFAFIVSSFIETKLPPVFIPKISMRILRQDSLFDHIQFVENTEVIENDKRFLRLCYHFNTNNNETIKLEEDVNYFENKLVNDFVEVKKDIHSIIRELRDELINMMMLSSYKDRIIKRLNKKNTLLNKLIIKFINYLFKKF